MLAAAHERGSDARDGHRDRRVGAAAVERKAVDVLDEALAAVAGGNERLGAFVHVDEALARQAAAAVDAAVAAGRDPGPFAGVPIGVKDLEDCAGMPTSHGSLAFAGRGPGDRRLGPRGPPAGRRGGADRQDGRARVRHPQLHPHQGVRHRPQPVGHRAHARRVERRQRGGGGRRPRPGRHRQRRRGLDPHPGGVLRARRVQAQLRPHPAPRPHRLRDRRSSGCSPPPWPTAPATSTWWRAPTTATASRCLRPRSATSRPSSRCPSRGCGPGGRSTWASPGAIPRCGRSPRRRPASSPTAAGLVLDDEPVVLTDPVRTWLGSGSLDLWLSLEPGMWPGVAADLTRYSRSVLEQTERLPGAQGRRVDPPARAARPGRGRGSSPRSTC